MYNLTLKNILRFSEFVKAQFRNLHSSPTLAMNELTKKLTRQGKQIIKFGFGQSPFPVPKNIVSELQKNAFQKDYLPVGGLPSLSEAICNFYKKKSQYSNYSFATQNIIIGPGSKQLMFWLQLVFNGDIVIPVPGWVTYGPQSLLCRNKIHFLETKYQNNWHVTQQDINNISKNIANKNKMILLNAPNNPTGTHPIQVQKLSRALRNNNFIVLSDEIYSQLNFTKNLPTLANYYPEKTIISTGLSKWCGVGGWRLGFHIYPSELKQLVDMIKIVGSQTFSSVSAPVQFAAIKAYTENHRNYLDNITQILKSSGQYIYDKLNENHIKVKKPTGGLYLMPDLTQNLKHKFKNSRDMCKDLLTSKNIAVLPGVDFGFDQKILTFRLSFVDFQGQKFLNFLEKNPQINIDQKILTEFAPNIVKGTKRLIQWIHQK